MFSEARALAVAITVIAFASAVTGFGLAHSGEASSVRSHHIVEIERLQFQPPKLIVAVGDTVTWVNRDIVPHTVTAVDADWHSGELVAGESWQWIVRADVTSRYDCEYHPTMRGAIIVR